MERDKNFFRGLLLSKFDEGKNAAQAFEEILAVYPNLAQSYRTCRRWFQRYKNGDFSTSDRERSGRPHKFDDAALQALLDADASQTENQLAQALGVARSTISVSLKRLGKIHKAGVWVPHELSEAAIQKRLSICTSLYSRNRKKPFLRRIITGDEKWIFYDNPKRKKSWVNPGQPALTQPKRDLHGKKIMLCIWWDQKGVVYYELLKPGQTVTAERYQQQLIDLNRALNTKRPLNRAKSRQVILQHDNARPHTAKLVKETLKALKWKVLSHPPYSPDVAPSDYHLFRAMQSSLTGESFNEFEDLVKWLDDWIASKTEDFFHRGIHKLPQRWKKVIEAEGKYFQ